MSKIKEFINKKNLFLLTSFNSKNLVDYKTLFIFVTLNKINKDNNLNRRLK
jgi:hypothetical protein